MPKNPVMAKGIEAMKTMLELNAADELPFVRASELDNPRAQVGQADAVGTTDKQIINKIPRVTQRIIKTLARIRPGSSSISQSFFLSFVLTPAPPVSKTFPDPPFFESTPAPGN